MTYIYQYDVAALFIESIVLFFYFQKRNIPSIQNKLFFTIITILIITTGLDLFCVYFQKIRSEFYLWIAECLYFTLMSSIGMLFAFYAVSFLDLLPFFSNCKRYLMRTFYIAPYIFMVVIIWLSFVLRGKYALVFQVENGLYKRCTNIWALLIYIISFYYVFSSFVIVFLYRKNTQRKKRLMLYAYAVSVVLTVLLQLSKTGLLIQCFGMALASLVFFFFVQKPEEVVDSITSILNQTGFRRIASYNFSKENEFTCIAITLDDTVFMANTFGIGQMNNFLRGVAMFLRSSFGYNNVFALSQGCLCVLIKNPNDEKLNDAIRTIQTRFRDSWIYGSVELKLYIRLCIIECPADVSSPDEIIDIIDLVSNDERYKQNIIFSKDIDLEYKRRKVFIEHSLRRGLTENRFDVYYQPIYSVFEDTLIGAEALIRLKDENGRFISPEDFIPIAEKTGTILRIGEYVFETVCRNLSQINLEEYGIKKIDINLSVAQCMQELLSEQILAINSIYQIPTSIINLEITETAAAHTPEILLKNVEILSNAGFELSLDDYGSGYSNMNYMLNLPFKMIKIDKYIVWAAFADVRAETALAATIKMIKSLGMTVLAEGVEEKDQAEWLIRLGCDYLQGYFYSKPMPKKEFLDIMRKNKKVKHKMEKQNAN